MSLTKKTSKISTLDAARQIYFIVAGLAVKQSLEMFSPAWGKQHPYQPGYGGWYLIAISYLVTVLRYSHGVALLHGHEKDRVENSSLASSSKVTLLALFLVLLGISFSLMASNIEDFPTYLALTAAMLTVDVLYISVSGAAQSYLLRPLQVWSQTVEGYLPRAVLWWLVTDTVLILCCLALYVVQLTDSPYELIPWQQGRHERLFALILIGASFFDYFVNMPFYFGGGKDWRIRKRFVFVCSPLSGSEFEANIRRAQFYSQELMRRRRLRLYKIIPFAPHAFYTYFLDDKRVSDRLVARQCALAYLAACDAIYVYVPLAPRFDLRKILSGDDLLSMLLRRSYQVFLLRTLTATPARWYRRLVFKLDKGAVSAGMVNEIEEAMRLGLYVKYLERADPPAGWRQTCYSPAVYEAPPPAGAPAAAAPPGPKHEGGKLRKRVYICTEFRGRGFDKLSPARQRARLVRSTRRALWLCHELSRDTDAFVAPFAPQAFYPFFCEFIVEGKIRRRDWDEWFERSIDILKACDAVYIYTAHGILHDDRELSRGMKRIEAVAEKLGIEVQYPALSVLPRRRVWKVATPEFDFY